MRLQTLLLSFLLLSFSVISLAQNTSPFWSVAGNSNASAASKLGTTNAIPLSLYTSNATRLFISPTGFVGIGTTAPIYKLHVDAGAGNAAIYGKTTGNFAVYGAGGKYGVYGAGAYGVAGSGTQGVWGSGTSDGVYGVSTSGHGVSGISTNSYGVNASSTNSYGIVAASTNAYYAGVFYGHVYTSAGYVTSDGNLKKNIQEFSDAMEIIKTLQPKHYEFKTDAKYAPLHLSPGAHFGLIAQDLEKVLPGLVHESIMNVPVDDPAQVLQPETPDGKDPNTNTISKPSGKTVNFTIKAVNYQELIPIMIKAMQEQQLQIEDLKKKADEVDELKKELADLKAVVTGNRTNIKTAYLEQNAPNPVNGTTIIRYHLPESTQSAVLNITNGQGQLMKIMTLNIGSGQARINTSAFAAGTYNYTLTVDGKITDTRRMVIKR
ncbi:MAG TPA: tail fiber domain-containing protein [Chryseolinea sp.]|nr:tail fiber domain-containing protein [Chryseolinea sp.]